jgi:proteic killer suppression protein
MTVRFADKKFKKVVNNDRARLREFGKIRALKLSTRLDQLCCADSLESLKNQPGNFHELSGDRKGQWACDLDQPYRLIFTSGHQPIPINAHGNYEWQKITEVIILEVINYH